LKRVWRRAGLVGSAAQNAGACFGHRDCSFEQLAFGLNSTRTGHDNKIVSANLDVTDLHHAAGALASLGDEIEAGELAVPFGIHKVAAPF
jgi:hypothetical protein